MITNVLMALEGLLLSSTHPEQFLLSWAILIQYTPSNPLFLTSTFNSILTSTPRSSKWSLCFGLFLIKTATISHLSHNFSGIDLPHNMWWEINELFNPPSHENFSGCCYCGKTNNKEKDMSVWTELIWPRTGTVGGLLRTQESTFGFHRGG